MTTSLKDVSSAQMVHALAEMNCFEQECTVYGYAWCDNSRKVRYTTSDNEQVAQKSFNDHCMQRQAMTPLLMKSKRTVINEELKEEIYLGIKLDLAKMIKDMFNGTYFEALLEVLSAPSDSLAVPVLQRWANEIDGYYNSEDISLYEGALQYAYLTNHLTRQDFSNMQQWVQQYKKQLSDELQVKDNYQRTFLGFAYETSTGKYQYVCNANQKVILEKANAVSKEGHFHTSIIEKTYWYHMSNELKNVRKKFETDIRNIMDTNYLKRMEQLRNLPSLQRSSAWEKWQKEVENKCSIDAVQGFLYWGRMWNLVR